MNDEELRHWQEIDHHLTELTKHVGWGALVEYAHHELMNPAKRLILNPPASYEWNRYLSDASWVRGITEILDAQKVVSNRVTNELERRRSLIAEEE